MEEELPSKREMFVSVVVVIALLIIAYLILSGMFSFVVSFLGLDAPDYSEEDVREKMEEHLYEKYEEEFVVDRIGQRRMRDDRFYQARIYPKSIIGTNKQGDDYYYASASVNIKESGELGGVGDSYSYVTRNMDMEEYLLPTSKDIFGERVLLKVDVQHKVTGDGSWWAGYKSKSLEEMKSMVEDDPKTNRIELDLDVYVFDRIEDEQEKEASREDIFEFVQYLKEEGLFEYLEMRVVFVDERVLAPSYSDFEREIMFSDKVRVEIEEEGTTVELPPKELREEMSEELQTEVDEMNEEELIESMQKIKKEDLDYEEIAKYNRQYLVWICSLNMLRETRSSRYEREKREDKLDFYRYENIDNIIFSKNNKYVFTD